MAEEIVACPGCAKKFRIPEGAESGSFACTACGVDVPYGAPAKPVGKAVARPAARPAAATARPAAAAAPAARAAAPARPAAPARAAAPTRAAAATRAAPARGRRPARDEDEPKKSNMGLIWGGIVVGGIALIGGAYAMTKSSAPPPPPPTPTPVAPPPKPPEQSKPAPVAEPPKPIEPPKPEPAPTATAPKPTETPAPDDASKPKPAEVKPAAAAPKTPPTLPKTGANDFAGLGQTFASVPGTTPEERTDLDKQVGLAVDLSSGKEGADAETKLVRTGKKAIPSLLSGFSKQYSAGKWASDGDQYAADKIQDLLHRIVRDDAPKTTEFWPRFMSGASADDFEKAARNWIEWWINTGQFKDKFSRKDK